MLRQLLLISHAKASSEPSGSDHDRPLTPSGLEDAVQLAKWLLQRGLQCQQVRHSTARRTTQTAQQLTGAGWHSAQHSQALESLYLATAGDLLEQVHRLDDGALCAAMIGHNPGLHQLGLMLAKPSDEQAYEALELSFPTSACLLLELPIDHWRDAAPSCARIAGFWTPRGG